MGKKALEKIKIKVPFLIANKNLIEKLFEKEAWAEVVHMSQ